MYTARIKIWENRLKNTKSTAGMKITNPTAGSPGHAFRLFASIVINDCVFLSPHFPREDNAESCVLKL